MGKPARIYKGAGGAGKSKGYQITWFTINNSKVLHQQRLSPFSFPLLPFYSYFIPTSSLVFLAIGAKYMVLAKIYQIYNEKKICLLQFHKKPGKFQTVGYFVWFFPC